MAADSIPADSPSERQEIPAVDVELFGVPRLLAQQEAVAAHGATLGDLGHTLCRACPALAGTVLHATSGWPLDGYIFVVDERFTRDPQTPLTSGSTVLLVSSAAGG
jgi:molybdopterin converting factor small subunit